MHAHARNEPIKYLPSEVRARATFDCSGVNFFFVFSIFDDHAGLCAVKSDKQKFKDKAFINTWSASQIKHITAKSTSRSRQKILFDIDYQSFEVGSREVFLCRVLDSQGGGFSAKSIWRAHFRSLFELFRGYLGCQRVFFPLA